MGASFWHATLTLSMAFAEILENIWLQNPSCFLGFLQLLERMVTVWDEGRGYSIYKVGFTYPIFGLNFTFLVDFLLMNKIPTILSIIEETVHNWTRTRLSISNNNRGRHLIQLSVADLYSKILDPSPHRGPNSFNFMQFLGKFGKIVCCCPPPPEGFRPTSEKSDPPLVMYRNISRLMRRYLYRELVVAPRKTIKSCI